MKIYNTMSKKKKNLYHLKKEKSACMYVDLLYTTLFTLVMQDR